MQWLYQLHYGLSFPQETNLLNTNLTFSVDADIVTVVVTASPVNNFVIHLEKEVIPGGSTEELASVHC